MSTWWMDCTKKIYIYKFTVALRDNPHYWILKYLQITYRSNRALVLKHNPWFFYWYQLGIVYNCPNSESTGDGFCDDPNNIFECDYDGGDCCGSNVNTQFCTDCLCPNKNLTAKGTGSHNISSFMKPNSHGT